MSQSSIGWNAIDNYLWEVTSRLFKYGVDEAHSEVAPLKWYITTGRASTDFLRAMVAAKPYMIARKLHEGGTYDEAIARLKKYLHQEGE